MSDAITYNDIMHINSGLYENEIYYKLEYVNDHTAAIYSLGSCACDGRGNIFHEYVEEYFKKKGLLVSWDNKKFTLSVTNAKD